MDRKPFSFLKGVSFIPHSDRTIHYGIHKTSPRDFANYSYNIFRDRINVDSTDPVRGL
jgi:hypothetical protein